MRKKTMRLLLLTTLVLLGVLSAVSGTASAAPSAGEQPAGVIVAKAQTKGIVPPVSAAFIWGD